MRRWPGEGYDRAMSDETAKAIAAELRRLADNLSDEWSPKQTRAWLRRRAGVISREPGNTRPT